MSVPDTWKDPVVYFRVDFMVNGKWSKLAHAPTLESAREFRADVPRRKCKITEITEKVVEVSEAKPRLRVDLATAHMRPGPVWVMDAELTKTANNDHRHVLDEKIRMLPPGVECRVVDDDTGEVIFTTEAPE